MTKDLLESLQVKNGAFSNVATEGHSYITFPKLKGPLGPRMQFNGTEKIIWSLNDYLGLATDPEIHAIDADLASKYSMAFPMGSRIMSGNQDEHELLEKKLANFVRKESAILFNFGYQGVFSSIDAILKRQDVVIFDEESHACIIDGVRLHNGKRMSFKHNDLIDLEIKLLRAKALTEKSNGGILVISEGVFSMRGDLGKLKEIVSLKPKYGFRLFIDDAHGFGVNGQNGSGTGNALGVQDDIDFYFATFAKSMASNGAFLASKKHVIDYLYYNTRSQVFAKALPIITTKGAIKRLQMIEKGNHLRKKMWENTNNLRIGLKKAGLKIGEGDSPITPVYMEGSLVEARNILVDIRENHNIFCSGVIYPVVPKGVILFRLVATKNHTSDDINETIEAFKIIADKIQNGYYLKQDQNRI